MKPFLGAWPFILALVVKSVIASPKGGEDYDAMMESHCGAMKEPTALCKIYAHKKAGRTKSELPTDIGRVDRDEFKNARATWCAENGNLKEFSSFCAHDKPMRKDRFKDRPEGQEHRAKVEELREKHKRVRPEMDRDERTYPKDGPRKSWDDHSRHDSDRHKFAPHGERDVRSKERGKGMTLMYKEVEEVLTWWCVNMKQAEERPSTLCKKFSRAAQRIDPELNIDPGSDKKEDAWAMMKKYDKSENEQDESAEKNTMKIVRKFAHEMQHGGDEVHKLLDTWCAEKDGAGGKGGEADGKDAAPEEIPYLCSKWKYLNHDHKSGL